MKHTQASVEPIESSCDKTCSVCSQPLPLYLDDHTCDRCQKKSVDVQDFIADARMRLSPDGAK